ncbi:hypothetical protein K461DRAFT_270432 [Myriangium duriaei CBS 260.36]|uniref:Oxidoreductase AflY n=1 Tax=Myriangium duriaei CBS 260.36 TaxID=1168546 RepID=A0A9P4IY49_9PEZI|nr:hypothetical protein K461DRAFT_270432 [Myriangium duriaei CBS 260.36]
MTDSQTITLKARDATRLAFAVPNIGVDQADAVSKLLTKNHGDHRFHDHIVHSLITLYGLGASPAELQKNFDENATYQRPLGPIDEVVTHSFSNPEEFRSGLGIRSNYAPYLSFFTSELESHGIAEVLDKYLFARTPLADDMLSRLFASIVHPLIHLGFALEADSIPLLAEALAETAAHPNTLLPYFLESERAANASSYPPRTLYDMILAAHNDKSLPSHVDENHSDIGAEFASPSALPSIVPIASRYQIDPSLPAPHNDIRAAIAEQTATLAHVVTAAQTPGKKLKLDFLLIHALNVSIFLPVFLRSSYVAEDAVRRLVEWNARNCLVLYAHVRCPKLYPEIVAGYEGREEHGDWERVFREACVRGGDGHLVKVVRALAAGERWCREWEGEEWLKVRGQEWRKLAGLTLDSMATEEEEPNWVFGAGGEEAWKDVPAKL